MTSKKGNATDLMGQAIWDFYYQNDPQPFYTQTQHSEEEEMEIAYLFRSFNDMPAIEQKALRLAKGNVLDIGCGAGSHALYLQETAKLNVTAIDISAKSIEVAKARGVKNVRLQDVMAITDKQYDTLLLLMNGTGICGTLQNVSAFLQQLKKILSPSGQILIDSSDLIYLFESDEDEEEGVWIPGDRYYGELQFETRYKNQIGEPFWWLYLDDERLALACEAHGLRLEIIQEGEHYDYLARITHS